MDSLKTIRWILFLRGLLTLAFAVILLVHPALTLSLLVLFFAVYLIVNGVFTAIYALFYRKKDNNWPVHLFEGLIAFVAGFAIWQWPAMTSLLIIYFIGSWAIFSGIMQFGLAWRLGLRQYQGIWLLLGGLLSVIFGGYLIAMPGAGALALAWLIGLYALLQAITLFCMAWRAGRLQA